MSGQDWLCSVCTPIKASRVCFCGGREAFYCEKCFHAHHNKSSVQAHVTLPVSAYGQHIIPGYFERLQSRSVNIPPARDELLRNITRIDECIAEVNRAVEKIISAASDYRISTIERLREQKANVKHYINKVISEVEQTMYEDAPFLRYNLARDLRMEPQDLEKFKCFTYSVDPSTVLSDIKRVCSFDIKGIPYRILRDSCIGTCGVY